MSGLLYLDASALVKIGRHEAESDALLARIVGSDLVSSEIAEIEVRRAFARSSLDAAADEVLAGVYLYAIDAMIRRTASSCCPSSLRTLDAIHLATARRLEHELDAFICYDIKLLQAARDTGFAVEAPRADAQ